MTGAVPEGEGGARLRSVCNARANTTFNGQLAHLLGQLTQELAA
jgi:hypothetical protein